MTRWVAFAVLTLAVLAVVLLAARATERVVTNLTTEPQPASDPVEPRTGDNVITEPQANETPSERLGERSKPDPDAVGADLSSIALFANVSASQALFASILILGIWLAEIPMAALGIGTGVTGRAAVAVGIAVGIGIAVINTVLGGLIKTDPSAKLRAVLAPDSGGGWIVLLVVVLPLIAAFEEFLFRAILIGVFSTGFDVSPWLLAVGSSLAFAAGHGAQGRLGIAATGILGFVLAAVFVLTESLLVVVVAHYIINAVEFVVVEGLGYQPFDRTG